MLSFYAHDDWRVSDNLTLNLGVRWEIEEPLTEAEGRFVSGFDFDDARSPIAGGRRRPNYARNPIAEVPVGQFAVRGGLLYPDTGGPSEAWERNLANIMPRAGFAWLVTPRTSVRGGYGLFYDVLGTNRITVNQVGYSRDTSADAVARQRADVHRDAGEPVPETGLLEPVGSGLGLMTNVGLGVSFPYVGEVKNPRNHRWSLGLQRELPWQLLIEATYVGAHGREPAGGAAAEWRARLQYLSTSPVRDDATNNRLTQQVPNPFAGLLPGTGLNGANVSRSQLLRPYPQFTSVQATETIGAVRLPRAAGARRAAHGERIHRAGRATAWSRTMIETGYLNDADTELERVISNFDREHTFVSSGLVELPFGRDRRFGRNWSGRDEHASRRLAGRLHLQSAERRAARVRQLPVRRWHGRRRHHGRQPGRGSVVQRQRVQSRHRRSSSSRTCARNQAGSPRFAGPGTPVLDLSVCSRTSASAAPASSSSGSRRTTR